MAKVKYKSGKKGLKGQVTLKLNFNEAQFLYDLLGNNVLGDYKDTRRSVSDAIWEDLESTKVFNSDTFSSQDLDGFVKCKKVQGVN